jgi:hypothetical protein
MNPKAALCQQESATPLPPPGFWRTFLQVWRIGNSGDEDRLL